jgi:DNA polymerase-3 subunit gamma/tau
MAYVVLARKYRPDSWDKLIAQDHVTSTLKNAIQHQRLAHAYLFTGPRGVGKTSAARILAKALNCETGLTVNPCNKCSNCQEIAEGRSVDVFEIDGASNRGIDEVRNLRENIRYTPAKSPFRIYIIDEVHMLTTEAFNALLKTLEEPPDHVLFIFATTEPHKVPATIVSRCQRFDFRRVSTQTIMTQLDTICREEDIQIEENALHLIARKADGSIRDSQSILDQMIAYSNEMIRAEDVIQALGLIDDELFFRVTDVIAQKQIDACFHLVDEVFSAGYDLEEFLNGLGEHLRNMLVVRVTDDPALVNKTSSIKERYLKTSRSFAEEDILRMIQINTETSTRLKYAENTRLVLEMAMVKMAKMDKTVTIEELISTLTSLPRRPEGGQKPEITPPPKPDSPTGGPSGDTPVKSDPSASPDSGNGNSTGPADGPGPDSGQTGSGVSESADSVASEAAPSPVIDVETMRLHWDDILECVKKKKITVGSFLQEGVPVRVTGDLLEIGFGYANGFHVDAILRGKCFVSQAIKEILDVNLRITCIKGDFNPAEHSRPLTREEKKERLRSMGEQNGIINKLMDEFDVEIVD